MDIPELLFNHFTEWQKQSGRIQTSKAFAEHLGVSESLFSMVLNRTRKPSPAFIIRCAQALSDNRFYELSGVTPPNSPLHYIQGHLKQLTHQQQETIWEQVQKYIKENQAEYNVEKTKGA